MIGEAGHVQSAVMRARSILRSAFAGILVALAIALFAPIGAGDAAAQIQAPTTAQSQSSAPAQGPKSFLPSRPQGTDAVRPPQMPTGILDRAYYWIMQKQAEINRSMAASVRALKQGGGWSAALVLAGIGFLYGVLHAAGPGHGKAVISSYVLADGQTLRRGVMLSFLAAFVQALSALVMVSLLVLVLKSTQADIKTTEAWLETASWGFVAVFGAWLFWRQARLLMQSRASGVDKAHVHGPGCGHDHSHDHAHTHTHRHDHTHEHSHGHSHGASHEHSAHEHSHADGDVCATCGHSHMPAPSELKKDWSWRRALALAFGIGIRPCTGAILVLVFAISQGLLWAGVLATFTMAIGTAITVSILAALAVGSRDLATKLAGQSGGVWAGRIQQAAGLGGAALVMVLGTSLFLMSLKGGGPF